jgi:spermidine synthase
MQSKNRGWMVLALFFGSGATALIYEVVWAKFLAQIFGSTIYAQTVVLAVFMGGLALGNRIFGGWADGWRQPVKSYGVLEILIGIYAFLFPALDRAADRIFIAAGTPIAEHTGWLLMLKGILSAALLLGPTILMGGTLPLLAAWLQKYYPDAGRRSARFYSVNSLGAVMGATLAGFWLVQHYGMIATLQITATANVIIGASAILLSQSGWLERPVAADSATTLTISVAPIAPETLRWAGLIVALTGAVSMGLEVLASRSLALIFGSSLQSFAVVLIAFILGIGLGSAWIASPKRTNKAAEKTVALLLCGAATWVTLLVFNIERWVDFYQIARTGLGRTEVGYVYQLLLSTGIAMVILGVPAACIGAVLPLMIRAISFEDALLGARVGALLTWNTLGAVVGSLFTGFVLMPQLGLRNAFGILALVLGLGALVIALRRSSWIGVAATTAVCGFSICLFIFNDEGWQNVMSSGVFRVWETKFDPQLMPMRQKHIKIRFYEDAPDATVSVEEVDGIIAQASLGLRINGKPDASTGLDLSTQFLLAHLPMLVKPDAQDVFVLGLGSGMTAGALLAYPVKQIVIAENCQPVVDASELFGDWNRHVVHDPRTQVMLEDARTVLKLKPQRYDVLITEPSNPWTVGVGSVFSREFYELAANRLKPGGLVCQWFHVYEMNDDILKLVFRTFSSVFPYMEIWDTRNGDIVMLGSLQPWRTGPEVFRQGFAIDRVRTDMAMININSPEALLARQLASQRTGFAIAGAGPIQSDLFPILEYAAPRAFFIGNGTRLLDQFDERTRQQLLAPPEKRAVLHSLSLENAQYVFSDFSTINGELFGCLFGAGPNAGVPCAFQTPQSMPPPASDGSDVANAEKAFQAGDLDQAETFTTMALKQNPDDAQAGYVSRVVEREKKMRQLAAVKSN